jgi:hypothetical protein
MLHAATSKKQGFLSLFLSSAIPFAFCLFAMHALLTPYKSHARQNKVGCVKL